jgi:hypothetical protein
MSYIAAGDAGSLIARRQHIAVPRITKRNRRGIPGGPISLTLRNGDERSVNVPAQATDLM